MSFIQANPNGTGGGGTPSLPFYGVQYNNSGSFFADNEFTRNPITHESVFGFQVYAQGTVDDVSSQYVDWQADNLGSVGNSITLTFDGIIDTDTALANWNASNPSNTASVIGGTGNFVPPAQTVTFSGGGQTGYELTRNLLGQGFQFAGSTFSDGATGFAVNGLLNTGGSGLGPFLGAFDFSTNKSSILRMDPTRIDSRVENGSTGDVSQLQLNPTGTTRIQFQPGDNTGESGFDMFYHTIRIRNAGYTWDFPDTPGTPGQVLTTQGSGTMMTWETVSGGSPALNSKNIGFGSGTNLLTGSSNFEYNSAEYQFTQRFPNNINGGTILGSPLTFGAASFTGSGLDDLTLNWSVSNYQSKKYGGNLTIQIDGTGTPDTFSWIYTGPYSEVIGQGTGVAITGALQNLSDSNGNTIAAIQFGATTGHTNGNTWTASTSLASNSWGMGINDSDGHQFVDIRPVYGTYYLGDDNAPTPLAGNGTRLQINDAIAELGLYAKRYFRIENPGGSYTAVLADMNSKIWANYGIFRVLDPASGSVWFDVDALGQEVELGDVQSAGFDTVFRLNDNTKAIDAITDGAFTIKDTASNTSLISETSIFRTRIGDVMSAANDTVLDVNDNAKTISLIGGIATSKIRDGGNASTITVVQGDYIVKIGATSIGATIDLPAASSLEDGTTIIIKDASGRAGTNGFIIDPNASETIDGSTTYTLTQAYESVTLVLDKANTNWMII